MDSGQTVAVGLAAEAQEMESTDGEAGAERAGLNGSDFVRPI